MTMGDRSPVLAVYEPQASAVQTLTIPNSQAQNDDFAIAISTGPNAVLTAAATQTSLPTSDTNHNNHKGQIIGGVVGSVVALLLIFVGLSLLRRRRAQRAAQISTDYHQDMMVRPQPKAEPVCKDFGYGWNEKAVAVGEKS
ncbi:hypothetical protein PQX77_018787 [Marasmius sp. AFHP31]|nr:hypothetical protein PQX77_018787 [Marasmius sp. AFHP31]